MRIVVIGGCGQVGAKLVGILRHRGHDVVAASRRSGVNSITGEGLYRALAGATCVVDVTNSPSFNDTTSLEFFRISSRNLLAAAQAARIRHFVALSVVGSDRLFDSGYFRAKLVQEDLIRASPIPHTILRSTQFYEFISQIAQADKDGQAVRVSPALVQPVAADEVAAALADITTTGPRNGMIEHAGPELFRLDAIVRCAMQALQDPRETVTDRRARYFGAELSDDTLTPDEGAILGVTRFDEWLSHAITFSPGLRPQARRNCLNNILLNV